MKLSHREFERPAKNRDTSFARCWRAVQTGSVSIESHFSCCATSPLFLHGCQRSKSQCHTKKFKVECSRLKEQPSVATSYLPHPRGPLRNVRIGNNQNSELLSKLRGSASRHTSGRENSRENSFVTASFGGESGGVCSLPDTSIQGPSHENCIHHLPSVDRRHRVGTRGRAAGQHGHRGTVQG